MKVFGERPNEFEALEQLLRNSRPQPPDGFADETLGKIHELPAKRRSVARLGLALAFALLAVLAFGAVGGLGYAKTATTNSVKSTAQAVSNVVNNGFDAKSTERKDGSSSKGKDGKRDEDDHGSQPAHHQYDDHELVCHHPPDKSGTAVTISIPKSAFAAHRAHGDTRGRCPVHPGQGRPTIKILSIRLSGKTVYAQFRICDDSYKNVTILATDSRPGVPSYTHRFATLIAPRPCGVYARHWTLMARFRGHGKYTLTLRARDRSGHISLPAQRSFTR